MAVSLQTPVTDAPAGGGRLIVSPRWTTARAGGFDRLVEPLLTLVLFLPLLATAVLRGR
jgi:hypothetical protein